MQIGRRHGAMRQRTSSIHCLSGYSIHSLSESPIHCLSGYPIHLMSESPIHLVSEYPIHSVSTISIPFFTNLLSINCLQFGYGSDKNLYCSNV